MKTIGIKLADGSFYPVLEEFSNSEKQLDLTTAHNNQTKVMVDLYRSKNCSMDDAEYVDSLQIENLVAHPNGEPDISFSVSIDENNKLSAKIKDTETGNQSKTTITLVSRTLEERLIPDDYKISDSDTKKNKPKTSKHGFFAMASQMRQTNEEKDNNDNPSSENSTIIGFTPAADDEINKQNKNQAAEEIIPDDETNEDFIIEDNVIENDDITEISETSVPEPLPDNETDFLTESNTDENAFSDSSDDIFADSDIPASNSFTEETVSDLNNEDFNTDDLNFDFQNEDSKESDKNPDETLLQEDEPFAADQTDFLTESNTDENSFSDSSNDIFADSDIPASNSFTEETVSDLNNDDFNTDDLNFDFQNEDSKESDKNPDETLLQEDEPFAADQTDFLTESNTDENTFSNSSDDIFADSDTDNFSIPDIPDIEENDDFHNNSQENEDFFNLDNDVMENNSQKTDFTNKNSSSALSFTGLYDKETELGESAEDEKIKKKTKVPVIICIICAIICIIATLLILFIVPSKYNLFNKKTEKSETEIVQKEVLPAPVETEPVIELEPEPQPKPEPEIIPPPAKEEEIVIVEEAEIIVPEQPPVTQEKPKNIVYKIKWGDTLWDIADTYYKDPWRYKYIARFNKIKDPDYIISGTYITIPAE